MSSAVSHSTTEKLGDSSLLLRSEDTTTSLFEDISAEEELQLIALADNALSKNDEPLSSAPKRRKIHTLENEEKAATCLRKVISGGQSGADRAALEAASRVGLATGGWIPEGFLTSEGRVPELGARFGLRELCLDRSSQTSVAAEAYVERSKRNVDDADATLAFRLAPSRGTDRTIGYAQTKRWQDGALPGRAAGEVSLLRSYRACMIVTSLEPREQIIRAIVDFVQRHRVQVLNVAGHRASTAPVQNFRASVENLLCDALAQCVSK